MTREEMEMRKLVRESDVIDKTNGTELARTFNHLWNKYIEQEPILDKIKAEITENAYPIVHGVNNRELGMTLYGILEVIDKYKVESEVEE